MPTFGGVKRSAPQSERVAPWSDLQQAQPVNGHNPKALEFAAWYVAGALCTVNGHHHPYGAWPCAQSLAFALTAIHRVASHQFPTVKGRVPRATSKKTRKKSGRRAGR